MKRVAEPSVGLVHYDGPPLLGNATDWLGCPPGDGEPTTKRVTCRGCLDVVAHVREHLRLRRWTD